MDMADRGDLEIYQGDDYGGQVFVTTDGTTPANIAGYTAQAQIRQGVADSYPNVLIQMQATVSSPYVNLAIPRTQTLNLTRDCYWDLQLIATDGTITTIMAGQVVVVQEVTRP
jgi:hypothetical protein